MPTQQNSTDVKPDECDHPESERFTHDFGQGGYLNKPKGERILCGGCGTDLTDELDEDGGPDKPTAKESAGFAAMMDHQAAETRRLADWHSQPIERFNDAGFDHGDYLKAHNG